LGGGDNNIELDDVFERVSTFHSNKKSEVQSKNCEFKLTNSKGKNLQSVSIDMAQHVGNLGKETEIYFSKPGISMFIVLSIIPACRVKHAHLFKQEENEEGNNVSRISSNA
jgi:hypothetical protein